MSTRLRYGYWHRNKHILFTKDAWDVFWQGFHESKRKCDQDRAKAKPRQPRRP
jgi:hypothetical protein